MSPDYEKFKIMLDTPSNKPVLGYKKFAKAFKEIIENDSPRFAIGIFGKWGTGKTTIMREIDRILHKDKVISLWFNAWRYEREEHLIIPLLDTLQDELLTWSLSHPKEQSKAQKLAHTIRKIVKSLISGFSLKVGLPGTFTASFKAMDALSKLSENYADQDEIDARSFYYSSFKTLKNASREFCKGDKEKRIVVFIDDLDRCLPDNALEILESVKLFFDIEGYIFVVGLDQENVAKIINSKYRTIDGVESYQIQGTDYIKKIFQVPFTLQPISIEQIEKYVKAICEEAGLQDDQKNQIKTTVFPHLKFLAEGTTANPREIKRYLNTFTLQMKINPEYNPDVVLAFQTIFFRPEWKIVKETLLLFGATLIEAIRDWNAGRREILDNLIKIYDEKARFPDSFLTYVDINNPGHVILEEHINLNEYLYSGEAVQTETSILVTVNPVIFSFLNKSLQLLERVKEKGSMTDDQFGQLQDYISSIGSYLYTAETQQDGILTREMNMIYSNLDNRPDKSESLSIWIDEIKKSIQRLIKMLLEVKRVQMRTEVPYTDITRQAQVKAETAQRMY